MAERAASAPNVQVRLMRWPTAAPPTTARTRPRKVLERPNSGRPSKQSRPPSTGQAQQSLVTILTAGGTMLAVTIRAKHWATETGFMPQVASVAFGTIDSAQTRSGIGPKFHGAPNTGDKGISDPLHRVSRTLAAITMDDVLDVRLDCPPRCDARRVIELKHCFVIAHDGGSISVRRCRIGAELCVGYCSPRLRVGLSRRASSV